MKYKGQGKKDFVVMIFDDYLNAYRAFSKAVTINQAIWILRDKPQLNLTIQKITHFVVHNGRILGYYPTKRAAEQEARFYRTRKIKETTA